ncbi:MAG: hypothetical protein RBS57_20845 [Desulforhabdus sp.]|jgi:hypothetical protein|nr:hypothetical protein [Desulforhabdus sp.]
MNQALLLPKGVASDPRGPQLLRNLTTNIRPLWRESEIGIPAAKLNPELTQALRNARIAGHVIRGLEDAERTLAAEKRGIRMADRQSGVTRGVRVSRLLILANDGTERFYRNVEAILGRYGSRVLAVLLEVDARGLGGLLFGPDRIARLVMLQHKQAVASVLLAMAGQWENL